MIFGACLGDFNANSRWKSILRSHAAWLGLKPTTNQHPLPYDNLLSISWLEPPGMHPTLPLISENDTLAASFTGEAPNPNLASRLEGMTQNPERAAALLGSRPLIWCDLKRGEVYVAVPATSTEQLFYSQKDGTLLLSNDMRLLARWGEAEVDPHGAFAMLEYRAIPPPYTLFRHVRRVPYGGVVKFAHPSKPPQILFTLPPKYSESEIHSEAEALMGIKRALDGCLEKAPAQSLLFFSGGVDSGLLAARLSASGRQDIRLMHLAFDLQSEATGQARAMASQLGLPCQIVTYHPSHVTRALESIGRHYAFPFGDLSLTPTHMLVEEAINANRSPSLVIEGTGGDGAFGLANLQAKWKRLYSIPPPLRNLLDKGYRTLKLWQSPAANESRLRKVRRSLRMPLPHAAVLGNTTLDGIAYSMPDEIAHNLQQAFEDNFTPLSHNLELESRMVLLDLVHVCAGRFTAKTSQPLRQAGIKVLYPFLEPKLVDMSLGISWQLKAQGGKKWLLKRLLAEHLPAEMVYRPKESFLPPMSGLFLQEGMQAALHETVLAKDSPMGGFINRQVAQTLAERTRRGVPLNLAAYNFLWTIAFTSLWVQQIRDSLQQS